MSIRKNEAKWIEENNYYYWKINVQKDGIRKTFRSSIPGTKGKINAEQQADQWLDYGEDESSLTIDELYQQFIDTKKKTTSRSNYRSLENRYNMWIEPRIGRKKIRLVKVSDLQGILDDACGSGKSKKTIINLRGDISSFYKFCRKKDATHLIPELDIPRKASVNEKKILNRDEIKKMMTVDTKAVVIHRHDQVITKIIREEYINAFRLQLLTGLRPGEICGLEWKDIKKDYIVIRRSINIYGETTEGKNNNAKRTIPLSQHAKRILSNQHLYTGDLKSVFDITTEGAYRDHLKSYCRANGITVVTPYELRHTFVSSIGKQMEIGDTKQIVGHSENMDTFGVYGHLFDGDSQRLARQMDKITDEILYGDEDDDDFDGANYNI